ncbi:MAG TPA: peptidyl-prolyl cis-trans isomerase [Caulobacteraceae bacterium]|jgi:peptidyl-prolyl cis-trans isomerase D
MLRFFRALTKSWIGPAIMGLLLIALGFLGSGSVRSLFGGRVGNAVVQAGGHSVSDNEFSKLFQHQEEAYLQRTGQAYPLEEAVKQGADKQLVQQLADHNAYLEMLARSGIRPSDAVVAAELKQQAESGKSPAIAQIFDAVTGRFKPEGLQLLLQNNGISMDRFQRDLADEIADNDFGSAIGGSFQPPRIAGAIEATLALESRDLTYFVIPTNSVPVPPQPTDAQLTALIQQYKDRLMLPERRKITVVRFSAKAVAPTLTVDPAMVQQQFEAQKAKYAKPELRSLVEIPLNDPSKAGAVQAALARGEDPQAVAKSVGVDAVSYADQPQSAVTDAKAGAAAFAMKEGQVSGPVQGDFKTVILKVTKVTPAQAPDLAAARTQIEADLRQSLAVDKVYDLSQKFEDLRQGGATLAAAAAKLGLTAVAVGPITADGKELVSGQPNPVVSQKLLQNAFQLPQGGDSDVEQDADKGEYYAVHVDQVIPPSLPGLAEPGVRDFLTNVYKQQTVLAALQKEGKAAQDALNKGQTFEAVAATYKAQVAHQVGMQEATSQQLEQTLGQAFLEAAFGSKPGVVFAIGSDKLSGIVVGKVDALHIPDPKEVAAIIDQVRQRTGQGYLDGLQQAVHRAALAMVKPTTDLALARTAMGVDAEMLARVTKAPAGKAK